MAGAEMTSAHDDVLGRLRAISKRGVTHPGLFKDATPIADLPARFTSAAEAAGAVVIALAGNTIDSALALHGVWNAAQQVVIVGVDVAPPAGAACVDVGATTNLHDLATVDAVVMRGMFGVAENGAIWVQSDSAAVRAALVVTQHLILVVSVGELVPTMHQAYARVDLRATSYGVFISGPSKTADIEQSLVIGAHGPLSLTVLLD